LREIKTVSIIGLGALGILFGNQISKNVPEGSLRIIADEDRISRYRREKIFSNGEECSFDFMTPGATCTPADLIIFTVKFGGLHQAIKDVKNQVGEKTIIVSALNGISSEQIIGRHFGMEKMLYCVSQGMDAVRTGNRLTYTRMGKLCIGDIEPEIISDKTKAVADFFEKTGVPYEVETNMIRRMWGKFMLNVGINQTVAIYGQNFRDVQKEGPIRDIMIKAMKEVIAISIKEGVNLNEDDLKYWLDIADTLAPENKPSMRQDVEAKRYSELELFAGTVLELGKKHNIPTPVNEDFYIKMKAIEATY
jgi:2-dehydropantoate 2-reductase